MCFSKPSTPNYAEEDRAREDERQATVRQGTEVVNSAFGRFNPAYFQGIGGAFRDYYRPQVDQQAKEAQRAVELGFSGNANSSAANRNRANLERDRVGRIADVEAGAVDATNNARREVEDRRGNLLNLVEAGSSIENAGSQAISQANQQIGRPQFEPIGDLFGKYTNMLGTAARGSNAGTQQAPFWQKQIDFLRGGGSGSQTVVGGR